MADTVGSFDVENQFVQRKASSSASSNEKRAGNPDVIVEADQGNAEKAALHDKYRVFILIGLAALILGWWISSTVLEATRGRWYDILPFLKMVIHDDSLKARADDFRMVFLDVSNELSPQCFPLLTIRNIQALSRSGLYQIRW